MPSRWACFALYFSAVLRSFWKQLHNISFKYVFSRGPQVLFLYYCLWYHFSLLQQVRLKTTNKINYYNMVFFRIKNRISIFQCSKFIINPPNCKDIPPPKVYMMLQPHFSFWATPLQSPCCFWAPTPYSLTGFSGDHFNPDAGLCDWVISELTNLEMVQSIRNRALRNSRSGTQKEQVFVTAVKLVWCHHQSATNT